MEEKTKIQFSDIVTSALRTIDEFRSNGVDPTKDDSVSSNKIESRASTFYRAIGLPAFTDKVSTFDIHNNGNLFGATGNTTKTDFDEVLKNIKSRDDKFKKKLKDEEVDNFLKINTSKISIGIKGRTKGGIFPLAVDGRLSIQPTSRRIAEPFHKKAQVFSKVEYPRPLIELIILLRTKGDGQVDSTSEQSLIEDISRLQDIDEEGGFSSITVDTQNTNFEVLGVISNLLKIVLSGDGIVEYVVKIINDIDKVQEQISDVFVDSPEDTTAAERQQRAKRSAKEQKGELEKQEREREEARAVDRLKLRLLEYDDTQSQDVTKNMKDVVLASTILSLISTESTEVDEKEKEDTTKKDRSDQLLRIGNQNMDLILGIYTGLSGVDILVIITAMFIVPVNTLVALLNNDNITRLKELRQGLTPSDGGVLAALDVLKSKVEEIYKSLDSKFAFDRVLRPSGEGEEGQV